LLETRDVSALLSQQVASLSTSQIAGLDGTRISALSTANVVGLTTDAIGAIPLNRLSAIESVDFASLSSSQMAGFTSAQIQLIANDPAYGSLIGALNSANVKGLTTQQLALFTEVSGLTTASIAGLLQEQVASLSTTQVASLEQGGSLSYLTSSNVGNLNLAGLSGLSFSQLRGIISSLSTASVTTITTSAFFAINPSTIAEFTTAQLAAFHTSVIPTMSTAQISALQPSWFGDSGSLSAAQTSALYYSPLVFDIDGNGIRTLSVDQGVRFDLDADDKKDQTGWVGSGDGLLARDLDGDGQIDDGSELFGEATVLADGSRAKDGFEALASLDANRDGLVDAKDAGFASLKIWSDADADGYTDAGELKSLSELGITSVRVDAKSTSVFDNGNFLGLSASYERADGTQGEVADVWFRVSNAEELEQKAAALGEALTSYGASASGTGGAGAGASAKSATAQASLAPSTTPAAHAPTTPSALTPMVPSNIAELAELLKAYKLPESLSAAPTLPGLLSTQATQGLTGQSGFAKKDGGIIGGSSQGS